MNRAPEGTSRHHILFPRAEWVLRPQGRRLRHSPSLIPIIGQAEHDFIHNKVPLVPALGYHTLLNMPELWKPVGNTLRDIDSLCVAIDTGAAPYRVHPLERELAGLAIEALMMQKQMLTETGIYIK